MLTAIISQPLSLTILSVIFDKFFIFLIVDVNSPARIKMSPCPTAKRNSIITEAIRFLPIAANTIIPAKIGVEHGVPARANAIPRRIGYTISEFVLF